MISNNILGRDILALHPDLTGTQVDTAVRIAREWYLLSEYILREPCQYSLQGLQCGIEVALFPSKAEEVMARLTRLKEQYAPK